MSQYSLPAVRFVRLEWATCKADSAGLTRVATARRGVLDLPNSYSSKNDRRPVEQLNDHNRAIGRRVRPCTFSAPPLCKPADFAFAIMGRKPGGLKCGRRVLFGGSNGKNRHGQFAWPFRLVRIVHYRRTGRQGLLLQSRGVGHARRVAARYALYRVYSRGRPRHRARRTAGD
jgi:hypothetical protein